jgi:Cu2+-containing amine oxidase
MLPAAAVSTPAGVASLLPLQVVALLAERGFTDLELVACDPWSVHAAPQQLQGCRLIQLFMYGRSR